MSSPENLQEKHGTEEQSSPLRRVLKSLRSLPLIGPPPPTVAVISLNGMIASSTRMRRALNLADVAKGIEAAFEMRGLKAVALAVNSPGGSPVQARLIHDRIRALATEKKIPVIAFAEDVAASGGYMLSLAADEIFADESSIIGSIGVISAGFGFVDLINKIGVERRVYISGDRKDMLDGFQPERDEDVKFIKALQKDVHDSFIKLVRDRRGDRLREGDDDLFSGAFWTAAKAKEYGLIDDVADMRTLFRERYGEDVKLRLVSLDGRSFFARMLSSRGEDRAGRVIEETAAALEARALWSRYGL